jgi:hypothetical protein
MLMFFMCVSDVAVVGAVGGVGGVGDFQTPIYISSRVRFLNGKGIKIQ